MKHKLSRHNRCNYLKMKKATSMALALVFASLVMVAKKHLFLTSQKKTWHALQVISSSRQQVPEEQRINLRQLSRFLIKIQQKNYKNLKMSNRNQIYLQTHHVDLIGSIDSVKVMDKSHYAKTTIILSVNQILDRLKLTHKIVKFLKNQEFKQVRSKWLSSVDINLGFRHTLKKCTSSNLSHLSLWNKQMAQTFRQQLKIDFLTQKATTCQSQID